MVQVLLLVLTLVLYCKAAESGILSTAQSEHKADSPISGILRILSMKQSTRDLANYLIKYERTHINLGFSQIWGEPYTKNFS
jgi:hypothetical protein